MRRMRAIVAKCGTVVKSAVRLLMVEAARSTRMSEESLPTNNAPTSQKRFVYGRDGLFAALTATLQDGSVLLVGARQMGKTAVLETLARDRNSPTFLPLMLDLAAFAGNSLPLFWWDLSEALAARAAAAGIQLPERSRSTFAAEPFKAFKTRLLTPLQERSGGRIPLLLLDNADIILARLIGDELTGELQQLLNTPDARVVLATKVAAEQLPTAVQSILALLPAVTLGPLSRDETLAIVRDVTACTVAVETADYIYTVTGGAPAALDVLLDALGAHLDRTGSRQLQIADVMAVRGALARSRSGRDALALQPAVYRLDPTPEQAATIRQAKRRHLWRRARLPLAALVLILVLLMLGFGSTLWRDNTPAAVAALDAEKPVPSATPSSTPQPTPTLRVAVTRLPSSAPGPEPDVPTPSPTPEDDAGALEDTAVETANDNRAPPAVVTRVFDAMPMHYIPPGTFLMGAAEDDVLAAVDEQPVHQVTLSGFYMDQYEVSVAQYAAFLNELGAYERACFESDCTLPRTRVGFTSHLLDEDLGDGVIQYVAETGFSNHPANHISWYGAQAYCEFVGGRLPTEAEWEYAARGTDGRIYPWGNSPPDSSRAVFNSETYDAVLPVDALPDGASPFGIYGMAGSMWEWTADWYDEDAYTRDPARNPTGPETGLTRIIRGGAWPFNNGPERLRATNRHSLAPYFISAIVGFRCVTDLPE